MTEEQQLDSNFVIPEMTGDEIEATLKENPIPSGRTRLVLNKPSVQFTGPEDGRGPDRPHMLCILRSEDEPERDTINIRAFWPEEKPGYMNARWLFRDGFRLAEALDNRFVGRNPEEWANEVDGAVVEAIVKQRKNKQSKETEAVIDRFT
jgi:hypothetical protein